MEAAAALDALRGGLDLCDSQPPRRVQDYAGSLMEEVAKADCVSTRRAGEGWSRYTPPRGYRTLTRARFPTGARQIRPNGPRPLSHTHWTRPPRETPSIPGGLITRPFVRPRAARLRWSWTPLLSPQQKRLFRGAGIRLWVLSALQTLFLLPLGFLVLPLLYLAVVNPNALRRGLWRLRSDSAFRRLRYTLSPLLELRVRGLLPA
ncbi:Transmembrane protein 191C [Pteropus alecto]|uniref:Transmembrane protein 191C n=2 Tax=Pteropus alecto TaxID=9402 RepID=L5KVU0_PTEAL|nr:Transmembrane protein 191C [Pteropus alecto]